MPAASTLRTLAGKHFALVASLGVIVLSVARVFYFSNLNLPVALAVLSVADRASVLASTILNVVTLFTPAALLIPPARRWLLAGNVTGAPFLLTVRTALIWVPLSGVLLAVLTPLTAIVYVALAIALGVLDYRRRKSPKVMAPAVATRRADWGMWLVATAGALALVQAVGVPWQPVEVVSVAKYDAPVVGYVIGDDAGQTLVINRSRLAVWVPTADIEQRQLCTQTTSWATRTLVEGLTSTSALACPEMTVRPDPVPTPVQDATATPAPSSTP